MKQAKPSIHFVDKYLINPTNPLIVNLIGAGGTGSQVLTALGRINHSLIALGHAGLYVCVFDDDKVTTANLGRQLFAEAELGLHKSVALINRINRFFGTNWKAIQKKYTSHTTNNLQANITLSCVDSVTARFDIANALKNCDIKAEEMSRPIYWMDFGNSRYTGQVILSTVREIKQPASKKYTTVNYLPFITDEFKSLLQSTDETDTPSCSLAEALEKQDLFINSSLANLGGSLLWSLFREGMIENRGFFVNLKDFRTQPLKITTTIKQ
jgi:PRTRC genetic system ThiF family protein